MQNNKSQKQHKATPFLDLIISIVLPSVILMKFSGEQHLGAVNSLILALAFPLIYGIFELVAHNKKNFISLLGVISVLLTGGIGLLELDTQWLAIKEAAIPLLIGLAVLFSVKTKYPLVKTLIYNPAIINIERVNQALSERSNTEEFTKRLTKATYFLSGTFFFSAVLNYILATIIVTSDAGSVAFNEQLGELTIKSYFIIALPSMVMLISILVWLIRSISKLSQLKFEEIMAVETSENS
jgi:hypothetical protein